jgi:hypothetical protein
LIGGDDMKINRTIFRQYDVRGFVDIDLTEERVNNIKNASKIILVSNLSTANGESAKFYTSYGMDIRLGVYAKVKIELKKDDETE